MFVPYELVEVLLGQDLSAREAFLVSYPLLEDADLLEVCLSFLHYLQVASTAPSATEARPFALQDRLGLDTPIRPAVISARRETVLYRLLPDLRPRTGPQLPDALADNLGAGPTNIAAEMHADRQAREYRAGEARRPKTFRERYGDRITDQLLLIMNVVDNELLPPFYQELGARQKEESERVLLQREVDQSAECLGVLPFKVTPSQVIALKTFDFAGISMAEVGTGVPPLSIIPKDATSLSASLSASRAISHNHSQSEMYDLSADPSSGALSTADTQRLRNQKGYLPWDWTEARSQLRANLALLGSLCGNDHATTLNWQTMLRRFEGMEARPQHKMNTHQGPRLA
jgi:hypothetical protein